MKTPDKQWSQQKDKGRNTAERDRMRKRQSEQQKSEQQESSQQGGWNDNPKVPGRQPPTDRDRDYDPDGDRLGPDSGSVAP